MISQTALLVSVLALGACATTPREVVVTFEQDGLGVPSPVVDGVRYEMSDEERRAVGQAFVDRYCSAAFEQGRSADQ